MILARLLPIFVREQREFLQKFTVKYFFFT